MARSSAVSFARGVFFAVASFGLIACASGAPDAVLETGTRTLRCPRGELDTMLHRDTGVVREYYVGCNFMYSRVHCRGDRCYPAPAEPPCMPNVPCFKENPKTLQWELDEEVVARRSNAE